MKIFSELDGYELGHLGVIQLCICHQRMYQKSSDQFLL